jgi:acyl carrier protein
VHELISLIKRELNIDLSVEPVTPLISSGLIDSFHFAALIAALESHYRVRIDPADIGVDNFDTPQQMYQFLQQNR